MTESQKEIILGWKFNYYDRNNDDILNHFEEFNYHNELVKLNFAIPKAAYIMLHIPYN